ncbi:MAG: response regulator [Proteobacteria bacterium]|jgi:signal transduction histidine kinase|nr:response regulator [Desulfocapsa sp.]MBU3946284.1 response regulator [Pseudomonadota bacterium]MCG2742510.1 response regulator [Desulfobacteraceae bacterium]MBU3981951.1 response regulator [Pseudomonadota bacterium]MBU4028171.1 response regulator [Pseudomonadota bacterium]
MNHIPKILIVDDRKENLVALRQVLRDVEAEIIEAGSGNEALAASLDHNFALAILDVMMPGMSGFELAEHLHGDDATRLMPIIFVTAAYPDEQHIFSGYEAGCIDYIVKPYAPEVLLAKVRIFLELDRQRSELQNHRDHLEMLVAERTRELQHELEAHKRAEEEKEKLQSRLNQAQKLEAIGVLAGGIAHDFNNILTAIMGLTQLALMHTPPDSQVAQDLDGVLISSRRAADLVKQILTFSRQSTVDRIPLTLQPLVKESLKMLRSSLPSTITINEDIDPQCRSVLADPTQIHQIVMNLCTNAFHAMEKIGGVLSIGLHSITIDSLTLLKDQQIKPGEYIEFTVSDTGSGIGADIIDKIFDPYFTTKEVGKGTGLGLSITHGIIKSYDGAITVENTVGQGTSFHVYFPVIQLEEKIDVKCQECPRGRERILFVDDEENLARIGKKMLEQLGYTVTAHVQSVEALEAFRSDPTLFDLVITDLTMPGLTGVELAQRMLAIRSDIPIVLCTGFSQLIDEGSAKAIGIKELCLKPFTMSSLGLLVRKLLDGGSVGRMEVCIVHPD